MKLLLVLLGIAVAFAAVTGPVTAPNAAERQEILDAHNVLRRELPAKYMPDLIYDPDLEYWHNWQYNCVWEHTSRIDPNFCMNTNGKRCGENLSTQAGNNPAWGAFTNGWANEKADYTYGPLGSAGTCSGVCGHYTQMIWNSTTHIGCLKMDCTNAQGDGSQQSIKEEFGWNYNPIIILVCHYWPPGNYNGQTPYEVGTPPTCTPTKTTCGANDCGTINDASTCNQPLDCTGTDCSATQGAGATCQNNVCTSCTNNNVCPPTAECGTVTNSCTNEAITCGPNSGNCVNGNCGTDMQCIPTTCTNAASDVCDGPPQKCGNFPASGNTCAYTCGSCTQAGYTCESGTCTQTTCATTCGANENCQGTSCVCNTGFQRDTDGNCVSPPPSTYGLGMTVLTPADGANWRVVDTTAASVSIQNDGTDGQLHQLYWDESEQHTSKDETNLYATVVTGGDSTIILGCRVGQGNGRATDSMSYQIIVTGNSYEVKRGVYYFNSLYAGLHTSYTTGTWAAGEHYIQMQCYESGNAIYTKLFLDGVQQAAYGIYTQYYPNVGGLLIGTDTNSVLSNMVYTTSTNVIIETANCLSAAELKAVLELYTGAGTVTQAVIDSSAPNTCSKKRQAGVGSTFVVTMSAVGGQNLPAVLSTLNAAASANLMTGVSVSSVAPSTLTLAPLSVAIAAPVAGAGAGAGAAAGGGGLSTAAIVGIAIGATAAVIIGAVIVAAVVAAVIAGAVIVAKKVGGGDDYEMEAKPASTEGGASGADLFDLEGGDKHKSITQRDGFGIDVEGSSSSSD